MNKIGFVFLCVLYVTISILSFSGSINITMQMVICGILIACVGIPHGAIDHILYLHESKVKPKIFYLSYLVLMIAYVTLWVLFPKLSLILFLMLSAYHFGESQLSDYFNSKSSRLFVFTLWGINILCALIYYNHYELSEIFSTHQSLVSLKPIFNEDIHEILLIGSSLTTLLIFISKVWKSKMSLGNAAKEIYILALIHIAFLLLPILPAFTIYFVILHSAKVLIDEYKYLEKRFTKYDFLTFIKQLVPFTLLSLIGSVFLILLVRHEIIDIPYILLAIVLISIITLPHSLVMQKFYQPEN